MNRNFFKNVIVFSIIIVVALIALYFFDFHTNSIEPEKSGAEVTALDFSGDPMLLS